MASSKPPYLASEDGSVLGAVIFAVFVGLHFHWALAIVAAFIPVIYSEWIVEKYTPLLVRSSIYDLLLSLAAVLILICVDRSIGSIAYFAKAVSAYLLQVSTPDACSSAVSGCSKEIPQYKEPADTWMINLAICLYFLAKMTPRKRKPVIEELDALSKRLDRVESQLRDK